MPQLRSRTTTAPANSTASKAVKTGGPATRSASAATAGSAGGRQKEAAAMSSPLSATPPPGRNTRKTSAPEAHPQVLAEAEAAANVTSADSPMAAERARRERKESPVTATPSPSPEVAAVSPQGSTQGTDVGGSSRGKGVQEPAAVPPPRPAEVVDIRADESTERRSKKSTTPQRVITAATAHNLSEQQQSAASTNSGGSNAKGQSRPPTGKHHTPQRLRSADRTVGSSADVDWGSQGGAASQEAAPSGSQVLEPGPSIRIATAVKQEHLNALYPSLADEATCGESVQLIVIKQERPEEGAAATCTGSPGEAAPQRDTAGDQEPAGDAAAQEEKEGEGQDQAISEPGSSEGEQQGADSNSDGIPEGLGIEELREMLLQERSNRKGLEGRLAEEISAREAAEECKRDAQKTATAELSTAAMAVAARQQLFEALKNQTHARRCLEAEVEEVRSALKKEKAARTASEVREESMRLAAEEERRMLIRDHQERLRQLAASSQEGPHASLVYDAYAPRNVSVRPHQAPNSVPSLFGSPSHFHSPPFPHEESARGGRQLPPGQHRGSEGPGVGAARRYSGHGQGMDEGPAAESSAQELWQQLCDGRTASGQTTQEGASGSVVDPSGRRQHSMSPSAAARTAMGAHPSPGLPGACSMSGAAPNMPPGIRRPVESLVAGKSQQPSHVEVYRMRLPGDDLRPPPSASARGIFYPQSAAQQYQLLVGNASEQQPVEPFSWHHAANPDAKNSRAYHHSSELDQEYPHKRRSLQEPYDPYAWEQHHVAGTDRALSAGDRYYSAGGGGR